MKGRYQHTTIASIEKSRPSKKLDRNVLTTKLVTTAKKKLTAREERRKGKVSARMSKKR